MPPKVLVVDDEPAIVELIGDVLAEEGYRVARAQDGPEALDLAQAFEPDVVLCDVLLPSLSGWEVAARLAPTGARVVLMTAAPPPADPPARFLTKPFSIEEMLAEVAAAIAAGRT